MRAIFPIAYFGPVSYYKAMVGEGSIDLEIREHYVKQSLRNRMTILGPNGVQSLSIPVIKPGGNKTLTENILISREENWHKIHWKAIESAYASAPYFDHYGMEIHELLRNPEPNLVKFTSDIHQRIVSWLDLPVDTDYTKSYAPEAMEKDFRQRFRQSEFQGEYSYPQVFSIPGSTFTGDLSILDAILNLGPMARKLLIETEN